MNEIKELKFVIDVCVIPLDPIEYIWLVQSSSEVKLTQEDSHIVCSYLPLGEPVNCSENLHYTVIKLRYQLLLHIFYFLQAIYFLLNYLQDWVFYIIVELNCVQAIVEEFVRCLEVLRLSIGARAENPSQIEKRKTSSTCSVKLLYEHETVRLWYYKSVVPEKVMQIQRCNLLLSAGVNTDEGVQDNERMILREDFFLYLTVSYCFCLLMDYIGYEFQRLVWQSRHDYFVLFLSVGFILISLIIYFQFHLLKI